MDFMKTKSLFALCICTALLCTVFLGGCSKSTSTITNHGTSSADEVTDSVTEIFKETEPTETKETETPTAEVAPTESTTESQKTEPTEKPQNSAPSGSETAAKCKISLADGTTVEAKVGDTVTYTYYLKTPKEVECLQAMLGYTPYFLELTKVDANDMFPVITNGVIYNADNQGIIKYNAINLSGYNFKNEAKLITVSFKVLYSGSASVTNVIEFMDEKGGAAYVDNYTFAKDVKYRETLALK